MSAPAITNSPGTRGGRKAGVWVGGVVLVVAVFAGASFGRLEGTRSLRVTLEERGCDGGIGCLGPDLKSEMRAVSAQADLALQNVRRSPLFQAPSDERDSETTQPAATTPPTTAAPRPQGDEQTAKISVRPWRPGAAR
jgi:hypothetical protein